MYYFTALLHRITVPHYCTTMNKRLAAAMGAYAVLIAIAVYRLHGKLLYAVLILFGGLIAKTLIATKAGW
jgi:hypothetical protein